MTRKQAVLWTLVYVALVLSPVALLLLGTRPPGRGFWPDVAAAAGYEGLAILAVQFLLTARFRRAAAPFGIDIVYYFHRVISLGAVLLIAGHVGILLTTAPAWRSRFMALSLPLHLLAAVAAVALILVLIAAALCRKRLGTGYERWRRLHGVLAVMALLLAIAHVEGAGYYLQTPWKRGCWTAASLAWVALLPYVRIVRPWLLLRRPYRIAEIRAERADTWIVAVEPVGHPGLRFLPGQFAWLTLNRSPFSLNEHPFSITSSAAHQGRIEFAIKELGDFTRTVKRLRPGEPAYVDGPYGAFTPDYFRGAPGYVFIAGGIGIAPILGMLRTLADRHDPRPMLLIYGSNTWERTAFRDELATLRGRLALCVAHVLQQPPADWQGDTGLLTPDILGRHIGPAQRGHECFVCGPTAMIAAVERGLHGLGVPLRRVRSELFDLV